VSDVALGRETVAAEAPAAPDADAPVLAIPEGWVIDELARERLARHLTHAPAHIRGVVAETGALPSGASYRVHAERLCLRPFSAATDTSGRAVQGAVLLRPGVGFETRGSVVEVAQGPLLVDSGAHVHDPWRAIDPIKPASTLGRPPFPRRPVVVFLACEPDVEALDWARALVNNLVRRDVEGRLAMLDIAEGLHLTQPCLPTEESIRALGPDVIVALDQAALDKVPVWCGTDRSLVAMEFTPDVATTAELVSWRLEEAHGRLRARIGRRIDAPSLASLVNRLCSGPHPFPPTDAATPAATVATVRAILTRTPARIPEPATRRSVMAMTGGDDSAGHHLLDGLVDHLVGAGHAAQLCSVGRADPSAVRAADVVVIDAASKEDDVHALIETRRLAGQPTVAYFEPPDVLTNRSPDDAQLAVAPPRRAISCGSATTGSPAVYSLLRTLGLRAHLLPPLLTRAYAAELRSARGTRNRFADPVVGWHVGSAGTPIPAYAEAVAEAVLEALAERRHLKVEAIGEPSHIPAQCLAHPRVSVLSARPGAEALSRWTVQLWSPPVLHDAVADETQPLVEASAVGVPTVLGKPIQAALREHPSPGLLVEHLDRTGDWIAPLRSLLGDEMRWSTESREAMRSFDAMHGPAGSDVAVNRFLGWAMYTKDQP
jgi:hypothetical protein